MHAFPFFLSFLAFDFFYLFLSALLDALVARVHRTLAAGLGGHLLASLLLC